MLLEGMIYELLHALYSIIPQTLRTTLSLAANVTIVPAISAIVLSFTLKIIIAWDLFSPERLEHIMRWNPLASRLICISCELAYMQRSLQMYVTSQPSLCADLSSLFIKTIV
jgi:hypothetical protein